MNNQLSLHTHEPDSSISFLDVLTTMHEWANHSLFYIKSSNHLTTVEKEKALELMAQNEYRVRLDIIRYTENGVLPAADLDGLYAIQAKVNRTARYYEFPAYRLPDYIPPAEQPEYVAFTVETDTFANILFANDTLMCKQVNSFADLKPNDLITIRYRFDYQTPRKLKVGWLRSIKDNSLTLRYDNARLLSRVPYWAISLHNVIHLYKVITVSRDAE